MRHQFALAVVAGLVSTVGAGAGQASAQVAAAARGFEWKTVTPESQGLSGAKLEALKDDLANRKTRALLIVRNDKIVYEWYAAGHVPAMKHGAASLSKATVAGLATAVLLNDGKLTLDTPVSELVPAWRDDQRKRKITVRQLGSHTSGLADAEHDRLPHNKLTGWKGDFWRQLNPPQDPFTTSRDSALILFDPGTRLQYSNPGIAMPCYGVTAALRGSEQKDIRTLLRQRVMRPIGVADAEWSIGYGKTFEVDGLPIVAGWGGGSFTARSLARIGRLLLHEGDWDGTRVLAAPAVRQITGDAGLPGHCGIGFWTNADGRYPKLPKDTYYGAGAGDQLLIVVPSLKLIVVRNGETLAPEPQNAQDVFEAYHDQRVKLLFEPIVAAITDGAGQSSRSRHPASKVITGIVWAPRDRRAGRHSLDNNGVSFANRQARRRFIQLRNPCIGDLRAVERKREQAGLSFQVRQRRIGHMGVVKRQTHQPSEQSPRSHVPECGLARRRVVKNDRLHDAKPVHPFVAQARPQPFRAATSRSDFPTQRLNLSNHDLLPVDRFAKPQTGRADNQQPREADPQHAPQAAREATGFGRHRNR